MTPGTVRPKRPAQCGLLHMALVVLHFDDGHRVEAEAHLKAGAFLRVPVPMAGGFGHATFRDSGERTAEGREVWIEADERPQ